MPNLNRSFSRRIGKTLSTTQRTLLSEELPRYLFDPKDIPILHRYVAEIGIGMGDHFIERAHRNQDAIHIGFEPYLNGVANSLKLMLEHNVHNIRLWPNDMDMVFDQIPANTLSEVYVLFPDPWPKNRHHKRRIINIDRLKLFASKMRYKGIMYFVTDIEGYFDYAQQTIESSMLFNDIKSSDMPYNGYIQTKYHMKALEEGRNVRFLHATKI